MGGTFKRRPGVAGEKDTQEDREPQTKENEHMFLVVARTKSVALLNILFFLKLLLRHYIIQKGDSMA